MTTAFVLSGGGSLGAVQVGMMQALASRDVTPDLIIGTSVGAVNASFVASHGFDAAALEDLASIWRSLRRRDVFPLHPIRSALAVAGLSASLCSPRGLSRLIERHLGIITFDEAAIPLHIVATDVLSGREVLISDGDVQSAVVASCSIPGVFPAVERGGIALCDGGVADNTAISQAVALGADEVYVLPTGYACSLTQPPRSALGNALHALNLLIEQRLVLEVAAYGHAARVIVLPPLCPLSTSSIDFRRAASLIERARSASLEWLDRGGPALPHPERFLSLHSHVRSTPSWEGSRA